MRGLPAALAGVLAGVLSLTSLAAGASTPLDTCFERAMEALRSAQDERAAERFEACLDLAPADGPARWRVVLGVALAHESAGRLAAARAAYRRFIAASDRHPLALDDAWRERRGFVRETMERLDARLLETHGVFEVDTVPAGAEVRVEGAARCQAPCEVYLAPGDRALSMHLTGHVTRDVTVAVEIGHRRHLTVSLATIVAPAAPAPPAGALAEPADDGPGVAPWVVVGVGGAALLAAGALSLVAWDAQQRQASTEDLAVFNSLHGPRERAQQASWALYAVGGAAAAAGLTWWLVARAGPSDPTATVIAPYATRHGAGGLVRWGF